MLFPTVDFAIFFVVVFAFGWLLRPYATPWRLFMLAASLFFYGYWDARFVGLLGGSIVANHLFGRAVRAAGVSGRTILARGAVSLAVLTNLGVLGWFKYYDFFATSVIDAGHRAGVDLNIPILTVLLPVGISFFTFQALSYVIDVHRGKIEPLRFLDFAVYLAFFPQLVAGPIVRATEFAPQLIDGDAHPRQKLESGLAFRLIFAGLFKKVVVSSYLATELVDPVFAVPGQHTAPEILFATYAYAIQIYADFSGYTDIAIGTALLLGFRFPKNFDAPYTALSIQEFWRRWHMTLSRWLKDYLYIPLGGNRKSRIFTYRNLALTMVLGGLWHGAATTFVIWGAIHGGLLALERLAGGWWQHIGSPTLLPLAVTRPLRWIYTFHAVCLAWIFFRADSLEIALQLLGGLTGSWATAPLVTSLAVAVIAVSLISQFFDEEKLGHLQDELTRLHPILQGAALGAGLLLVDVLAPEGVAPFIYFQF